MVKEVLKFTTSVIDKIRHSALTAATSTFHIRDRICETKASGWEREISVCVLLMIEEEIECEIKCKCEKKRGFWALARENIERSSVWMFVWMCVCEWERDARNTECLFWTRHLSVNSVLRAHRRHVLNPKQCPPSLCSALSKIQPQTMNYKCICLSKSFAFKISGD